VTGLTGLTEPNGSGKATPMLMLTSLLQPDAGCWKHPHLWA
jgi:ABC-type Na+ transport system ATPase subunit NatA